MWPGIIAQLFNGLQYWFGNGIREYSNGWATHNDDNGASRLLTQQEVEAVRKEFPQLEDEKVMTVFTDEVKSIQEKP